MVNKTLMEAIQEHINNCKIAVANAIRMSSNEEVEKSLQDLEKAQMMPTHPEVFFEEQRKIFLCSSI